MTALLLPLYTGDVTPVTAPAGPHSKINIGMICEFSLCERPLYCIARIVTGRSASNTPRSAKLAANSCVPPAHLWAYGVKSGQSKSAGLSTPIRKNEQLRNRENPNEADGSATTRAGSGSLVIDPDRRNHGGDVHSRDPLRAVVRAAPSCRDLPEPRAHLQKKRSARPRTPPS